MYSLEKFPSSFKIHGNDFVFVGFIYGVTVSYVGAKPPSESSLMCPIFLCLLLELHCRKTFGHVKRKVKCKILPYSGTDSNAILDGTLENICYRMSSMIAAEVKNGMKI